jgi:two-component system, NarL family, response regulator LiaR
VGNQSIRVLIIDDHMIVRQGLKACLTEYADICVVGDTANGSEAIELVQRLHPDIVLTDLIMPVMDGIQIIKKIRDIRPDQRIIVLTAFRDDDRLHSAMDAGAICYLLKDESPEVIIQTIRNAHAGKLPPHS